MGATVAERLAEFVIERTRDGVPEPVLHEAKRLLLNGLKASVRAYDHPVVGILREWSGSAGGPAHLLWLGEARPAEEAALLNAALLEVLDFQETHVATYVHPTAPVLPAVLAAAEERGGSGRDVLLATALGIEVELAVATLLMPNAYVRGFTPGAIVGGVGAAAGVASLRRLGPVETRNALAVAMCSAVGPMETIGSMAHPYNVGLVARAGLAACRLAELGLETAPTAFEGEKGMLSSYSGESPDRIDGVLARLGNHWEVGQSSYKRLPTETITQAPLECVLEIRARVAPERLAEVERMTFVVEPVVARVSAERFARFGVPRTDLQARFDLRFCAAAAWTRGHFGFAETAEAAYTDPAILALRDRVHVEPDESRTLDGAALEIRFADGSAERADVPAFRGSAANPLSDEELSEAFRLAAADTPAAPRAEEILAAVWSLDDAPGVSDFVTLTHNP